ncbi:hypothetical protein [Nannocystis bainbridge]|uniref:Uncharacterized protein n=1 Tax=Nannocystis bainbridge TaxID=2995303 RepID=A0ABT5ECB9_9BACT|nr:hypothetical protein [Nannocystis bainbridge]MDC0723517.1 hypothetical protein [Nannocystis bainbridge]
MVPIFTVVAGLLAAQVPDPPALGLVWEAPGGCPGRRDLVAAIEQRLGRAFAGEVEVEARVALHAEAPRYRLTLRIAARGRGAVRTLTSQRCAALVDATALLVASAARREAAASGAEAAPELPVEVAGEGEVMTEESSGVTTAAETVSPEHATGSPGFESVGPPVLAGAEEAELAGTAPDGRAAAMSVEGPLQPPAGPARRLGGLLRIQGGAELGALPGVSGAIMLAGGLLWRRARLELRGAFLTPRTEVRAEGSLRAFAGMAAVLGCARLGGRRVEFPLCGGLEAGGVRGVAQDVVGARAVTGRWLALVASAGVAVVVHPRVRLGAALEGVAGLLVPRFEVRDPGPPAGLFASSRVSGRLLLMAELRFRDPR